MRAISERDIRQTAASLTRTLKIVQAGVRDHKTKDYVDGIVDGVRLIGICLGVDEEINDEVPEVREETE